jgi:hypothetical protein
MESIVAKVSARIVGSRNDWSLGTDGFDGRAVKTTECEVLLEIQGTKRNGYNLVMAPKGFFTADSWFKTKQEALESAEELFGVAADGWTLNPLTAAP